MRKIKFIIGIDEAGRGPLAGPVAVGAAMVPVDFDWDLIPGVGDSKKVSEKNREAIFLRAQQLMRDGVLESAVILVSTTIIDTKGITHAVHTGIERALKKLAPHPKTTRVLLDGLLHAPEIFSHQETIVKGDEKEKLIGLASILAKVTRDHYMTKMSPLYPRYGFEIHKGYGTKMHRTQIIECGVCPLHRASFCKRLIDTA